MPSGFLNATEDFSQLDWTMKNNETRTLDVQEKGYGLWKHKYRITHYTTEKRLTVVRIDSKGKEKGEEVSFTDLPTQNGKKHRTRKWIAKRVVTQGNLLKDREKSELLAAAGFAGNISFLFDCMSDGDLNGPQPTFDTRCQHINGLQSSRAKNVLSTMLQENTSVALSILKSKPIEFQIEVIKHQLTSATCRQNEKHLLLTGLMEHSEFSVSNILLKLIEEAKINASQDNVAIIRDTVKTFIDCAPQKFTKVLSNANHELLSVVMLLACQKPSAKQNGAFFSLLQAEIKSDDFKFAIKSISDFATNSQNIIYDSDIENANLDEEWAFVTDSDITSAKTTTQDAKPDLLTQLKLEHSSDCLQTILKTKYSLPEELGQERKKAIQTHICKLGQTEQWQLLSECIKHEPPLSHFHSQLVKQLLDSNAKNYQSLCLQLFNPEHVEVFISLHNHFPELVGQLFKQQNLDIQKKWASFSLTTQLVESGCYQFIKLMLEDAEEITLPLIKALSTDSCMVSLVKIDVELAESLISAQSSREKAACIGMLLLPEQPICRNTQRLIEKLLRNNFDENTSEIYKLVANQPNFYAHFIKIHAFDSYLAHNLLLALNQKKQSQWLSNALQEVPIPDISAVIIEHLLANTNPNRSAFQEQALKENHCDKLILINPNLAADSVKSCKVESQLQIVIEYLNKSPIDNDTLIFIKNLLQQEKLKAALCQDHQFTELLANIVNNNVALAIQICKNQSPQWLAEKTKSLIMLPQQNTEVNVVDFIGGVFTQESKVQIFAELAKQENSANVFKALYKVQQALVMDSIDKIDIHQQLQILISLSESYQDGCQEAAAIFKRLCTPTLVDKLATQQKPLSQQNMLVLELTLTKPELNKIRYIANNHKSLLTEISSALKPNIKATFLAELYKNSQEHLFTQTLLQICSDNQHQAQEVLEQLFGQVSVNGLVKHIPQAKLIELIQYMSIELRRNLALMTPEISINVFVALLQPDMTPESVINEDDLVSDWKPAISKSICKSIFARGRNIPPIIQKHLANLAICYEPTMVGALFLSTLTNTQLIGLLSSLQTNEGNKATLTIFTAIANAGLNFAANIFYEFVSGTKERAAYLQELDHPLNFKILQALPKEDKQNSTHCLCSAKDFLILECLKKEGLRKIFKLVTPSAESCPNTQVLVQQLQSLPEQCCRTVLVEESVPTNYKNYFLKAHIWEHDSAAAGLLELFSHKPFDDTKIAELKLVCKDLDDDLISNLLQSAHTNTCCNIVQCIPEQQIERVIYQGDLINTALITKLPANFLLNTLKPQANWLMRALFNISQMTGSSSEKTQRLVFCNQCIQLLAENRTNQELTDIFNGAQPPISNMLAKAMYQLNKSILIAPALQEVINTLVHVDEEVFSTIVSPLPVEIKSQLVSYCISSNQQWLTLLPATIFNEPLELSEEEILSLPKIISEFDETIVQELESQVYKLAWRLLNEDALAQFTLLLKGEKLEHFLSFRSTDFHGFKELEEVRDTMKLVDCIESLDQPILSTFITLLPKDSLYVVAHILIKHKQSFVHAEAVICINPAILARLGQDLLTALFKDRDILKSPLKDIIPTLPIRYKDDQLLAQILLNITPFYSCDFIFSQELQNDTIKAINNSEDYSDERKISLYSKIPSQQCDFFVMGTEPSLAHRYICEGGHPYASSKVMWSVLYKQGQIWSKTFEPLLTDLQEIWVETLSTNEAYSAQCLQYFSAEAQTILCQGYKTKHGQGKGELLEKKLKELNTKNKETRPYTMVGQEKPTLHKTSSASTETKPPETQAKTSKRHTESDANNTNIDLGKRPDAEGEARPEVLGAAASDTPSEPEHSGSSTHYDERKKSHIHSAKVTLPPPNASVNFYNLNEDIIFAVSSKSKTKLMQCAADFSSLSVEDQTKFLVSTTTQKQAFVVYPLVTQAVGFSEALFGSVFSSDGETSQKMLNAADYDSASVLKHITSVFLPLEDSWHKNFPELMAEYDEERTRMGLGASKQKHPANHQRLKTLDLTFPLNMPKPSNRAKKKPDSDRSLPNKPSPQVSTASTEGEVKIQSSSVTAQTTQCSPAIKREDINYETPHKTSTERTDLNSEEFKRLGTKEAVELLLRENQITELKELLKKFTIEQCAQALRGFDYFSDDISYFIMSLGHEEPHQIKLKKILLSFSEVCNSMKDILLLKEFQTYCRTLSEDELRKLTTTINSKLELNRQRYVTELKEQALACKNEREKRNIERILQDSYEHNFLTYDEITLINQFLNIEKNHISDLHSELLHLSLKDNLDTQLEQAIEASQATLSTTDTNQLTKTNTAESSGDGATQTSTAGTQTPTTEAQSNVTPQHSPEFAEEFKTWIANNDPQLQENYKKLKLQEKADLIDTLQPSEFEKLTEFQLLQEDSSLIDIFKLLTNNLTPTTATLLNKKLKMLDNDELTAKTWAQNNVLMAYAGNVFSDSDVTTIATLVITMNPTEDNLPAALITNPEIEHCDFRSGQRLNCSNEKIQVPHGFKFVSVPGYDDCLFRAVLYKETADEALLDVQLVPKSEVRERVAKLPDGDPIAKSVQQACSQIFEIEDRFIPLQEPLTKYAQNLNRNSIALLVKQRTFDSGKFNYYYTNGRYGMKNCFEGIQLELGLTELLNEFCEVLTYYISQCLLENMNTNVNIMVDPNRPIIIQRREHFDILMPIPAEESHHV